MYGKTYPKIEFRILAIIIKVVKRYYNKMEINT